MKKSSLIEKDVKNLKKDTYVGSMTKTPQITSAKIVTNSIHAFS